MSQMCQQLAVGLMLNIIPDGTCLRVVEAAVKLQAGFIQHRTQHHTAAMLHDTPSSLTGCVLCLPGHGSLQNSSPPVPRSAFASDGHGHGVPAHE